MFDKWYVDKKLKTCNIQQELILYSINNVVLGKCFEKFKQIIHNAFNTDVFIPITIAGLALNILEKNRLSENTIAIIDKQKQKKTQSL